MERATHHPGVCPDCGCGMEWMDCYTNCDGGYYDAYEDDGVNEAPGTFVPCGECGGDGGWWFCPSCYDRAYALEKAAREAARSTAPAESSPPSTPPEPAK